jgi:hypothetical protein
MNPQTIKKENERFLRSIDITVNLNLPLIESPSELKPRGSREIAIRSVVLAHFIGVGYEEPVLECKNALQQYGLYEHCTPKEKILLESPSLTNQQKINCSWLKESIQALAWCMGMVELNLLNFCDKNLGSRLPLGSNPKKFIDEALLRPFDEIYREADLHFRAHWAWRDAQLKGVHCKLQSGIVVYRRRALDWAVGIPYDWDEIPLDT